MSLVAKCLALYECFNLFGFGFPFIDRDVPLDRDIK
jgi:hypothetical protein